MKEQVLAMAEKIKNGQEIGLPDGVTRNDIRRMRAHEQYVQEIERINMEEKMEEILKEPMQVLPPTTVQCKYVKEHLSTLSKRI